MTRGGITLGMSLPEHDLGEGRPHQHSVRLPTAPPLPLPRMLHFHLGFRGQHKNETPLPFPQGQEWPNSHPLFGTEFTPRDMGVVLGVPRVEGHVWRKKSSEPASEVPARALCPCDPPCMFCTIREASRSPSALLP